jgi:hypothetical protein
LTSPAVETAAPSRAPVWSDSYVQGLNPALCASAAIGVIARLLLGRERARDAARSTVDRANPEVALARREGERAQLLDWVRAISDSSG